MEITRVGVIGSGIMGAGIAQVAAQAGYDVVLRSRQQATALFTGHPFSREEIEAIESGHVPPRLERREV